MQLVAANPCLAPETPFGARHQTHDDPPEGEVMLLSRAAILRAEPGAAKD